MLDRRGRESCEKFHRAQPVRRSCGCFRERQAPQWVIAAIATTRMLEVISDASRRLCRIKPDVRDHNPTIPWQDVMGVGNFYRHQYDNVAEIEIWKTLQNDLAPLLAVTLAEIQSAEAQPDVIAGRTHRGSPDSAAPVGPARRQALWQRAAPLSRRRSRLATAAPWFQPLPFFVQFHEFVRQLDSRIGQRHR